MFLNKNCKFVTSGKEVFHAVKRTILSSAYPCDKIWAERLETPLLKPIKMDDYAFQIFQRHDTKKFISPVDLDIYCNRSINEEHAENVKDMLTRVRLSKSYLSTLGSTHSAISRLLMQLKKDEELLNLITDKVKYGLFPDNITMNIIMDYFIKKDCGNYAAKISYQMMLQEDVFLSVRSHHTDLFKNDDLSGNISIIYNKLNEYYSHITPYLVIYSLLLHFKQNYSQPISSGKENKEAQNNVPDNEEMLYLRVPYLKRYHFDDHFDLLKPEHQDKYDVLLLGKSLSYIGNSALNDDYFNNIIGRSCRVLGLSLWKKFDKVESVLREHLDTDTEPALTRDSVQEIFRQIEIFKEEISERKACAEAKLGKPSTHLPIFDIDQAPDDTDLPYDLDAVEKDCRALVEELECQKKISDVSGLFDMAKVYVEANVKRWEGADMAAQEDMFKKWISEREIKLEEQIQKHFSDEKKKEIADKRRELEEEERLLTFFDNEKEIEIMLDKADKIRELIKRKNAPPLQAKDHFKSSFERMTS